MDKQDILTLKGIFNISKELHQSANSIRSHVQTGHSYARESSVEKGRSNFDIMSELYHAKKNLDMMMEKLDGQSQMINEIIHKYESEPEDEDKSQSQLGIDFADGSDTTVFYKIRLTKIGKSPDPLNDDIPVGEVVVIQTDSIEIKVGQRFPINPSIWYSTSIVQKVVSDNEFITYNSHYKFEIL